MHEEGTRSKGEGQDKVVGYVWHEARMGDEFGRKKRAGKRTCGGKKAVGSK